MDFIGIIFYTFLIVLSGSILFVCWHILFDFKEIESCLFKWALAFIMLTIMCVSGVVVAVCAVYKLPQALGF